ncbi:amidohydrolase [Pseudoclavibacter sp. AY1H1]|uniref:amidohydrolase n=1 Tax=Pseudoclavibacter sp. AY1H1 TaxID=2080584 RepID=UPI000CE79C28|nr:amidohydrolase [Pseudoclavibacter sp. AY1H1]PPF33346.1 amidohydrolase [Pseudoclavibacter sp. AY1H1]
MDATLFTNGTLYLGSGAFERASLLVIGDRTVDVIPDGGELPTAAHLVDLAGGTLLPGFQDAHVHPLLAGLQSLGIDLKPVHDRGEYLRLIADYAAANPTAPVLTGGGWFGDVFEGGFPTAAELEGIDERPIMLHSHDAHGMWVNTAALRAAGIDRATPDPEGGRLIRDELGQPTGMLLESAVALVEHLMPAPDEALVEAALEAAQHELHSVGVTAWQDAAVGDSDLGPNPLPAYLRLAADGRLTARVVLAQWWDRARGVEQIADFERVRAEAAEVGVDAGTVKVMIDGMVENHTASMLEPFEGHPGDVGIAFLSPEALVELTTALDAADFQVHFHAVGDAATRHALDAVEAAIRRNGRRGNRHHVAHLDLIDPSDIARFAELDVAANITAVWARRDEEIVHRKLPLLGAERELTHFPFGDLHRAGARIVGGSDWPVTTPNPLWSSRTAVTRTGLIEDPHAIGDGVLTHPLLGEQALPLGVALDAYLAEAAWVNRLEGETGRLEAGRLADLVWVDADLSDLEAYGSASVRRTYVGGVVVYQAP